MLKKVISIGMSFLMLFEFGTVNAFAKGGDGDFNTAEGRNTNKENYVDYCKDSPKNKYGNSENVRCAIKSEMPGFKSDKESFKLVLPKLGKTGEIDVHMWKYAGLEGLAKEFEKWIKGADVKSIKAKLTADFIEETNKLFNLNSEADATEIIDRWIKRSNYSAPFVKSISEDLDKWKEKMNSYDVSGD